MIRRSCWIFIKYPFSTGLRYYYGTENNPQNFDNGQSKKKCSPNNQQAIQAAQALVETMKLIANASDYLYSNRQNIQIRGNSQSTQQEKRKGNEMDNNNWIEENSLVQWAIKFYCEKAPIQYQKEVISFFRDGIQYDHFVFNQDRIIQAENKHNKKIIFCPTALVTSKIFKNLINKANLRTKNIIVSGMFGISKTFSFMLYCKLSAIVNKIILTENIPQQIGKAINVPKMIYVNMDPVKFLKWANLQADLFKSKYHPTDVGIEMQKKVYEYFDEIILRQCQQLKGITLSVEQMKDIQNNPKKAFSLKLKKYKDFYIKKVGLKIKIILLVDQINAIASQIRKYNNGQYKGKTNQKMQNYLACKALNTVRIQIMDEQFFDRRIFNSSINLEAYDDNILEQLGTFSSLKHEGKTVLNYMNLPYLEYFKGENQNLVSYQLADLILFQVYNQLGQLNYQKLIKKKEEAFLTQKEERKIVHEILQNQMNRVILTPLFIRYGTQIALAQYIQNPQKLSGVTFIEVVVKILQQCEKIAIESFADAFNKYIMKKSKQKQRILECRIMLFHEIYEATQLNIFQKRGNEYVQITINKSITGLSMQQTIRELFDRNLFEYDNQKKSLISLLPSNTMFQVMKGKIEVMDAKARLQFIGMFTSQGKIKGGLLQQIFIKELSQSQEARILTSAQENSEFNFQNLHQNFYMMSKFPDSPQNNQTKRLPQPLYFIELVKAIKRQLNNNQFIDQKKIELLVVPTAINKVSEIKKNHFKVVDDKKKLAYYRGENAKLVDFAIFQRKKEILTSEKQIKFGFETYNLHFFDFTVGQQLNSKKENFERFIKFHQMKKYLSKIKLNEILHIPCKVYLYYNIVGLFAEKNIQEKIQMGDFTYQIRVIPLKQFKLQTDQKIEGLRHSNQFNDYVKLIYNKRKASSSKQ